MAALFFRLELQRLLFEDRNRVARRDLRIQREFRDNNEVWELDDLRFRKNFRLTRDMVLGLCDTLRDSLQGARKTSLPVDLKILIALRFYARGSYQLDVAQNTFLGVSQSSVSRCLKEATMAINETLVPLYINFPRTEIQKTAVKLRFQEECNFPGTIGAIDCTHVAIVAPANTNQVYPEYIFVNRKSYYSMNVQLICDYDLLILSADTKFPGSTHDSNIFGQSDVKQYLEESYRNGTLNNSWLIGDSGYGLTPWLLVPILDERENSNESRFMEAFLKARCTIERCNGCLKQRFRCLLNARALHYEPPFAAKIIMACCVLHNMCILNGFGDNLDLERGEEDEAQFVAADRPHPVIDAPRNENYNPLRQRVRRAVVRRFRE